MARNTNKKVVLMSIQPKFARAILDGTKTVELRRNGVPIDISRIVIYATKPIGRIVGHCKVTKCSVGSPEYIWRRFGSAAGISRAEYDKYFDSAPEAKCYALDHPRRFSRAIRITDLKSISSAPQSFAYLSAADTAALLRRNTAANSGYSGVQPKFKS